MMKNNLTVEIRQLVNLRKVPEDLQDELRTEATKQIDQLKRRLKRWPEKVASLYLSVYPAENINQWKSHLTLTLESEIISIESKVADKAFSSLDEAFNQLFVQLDRYITQKRQHKAQQRKSINKKGMKDIGKRLDQAVADDQQPTFLLLLKPHLDGLRKTIGREIHNLEINEHIHRGSFSTEDLINETLLRAWKNYHKRPKDISTDQWLLRILFQIVKEAVKKEKSFVALAEVLKPSQEADYDPDFDSDQWWWSQIEPRDDILYEDLLPGEEIPVALKHLTQAEENEKLTQILNRLPQKERQIISLFTLDGYHISEIAKIMNLSDKEIKLTMEKAKNKIRDLLAENDSGGGHE